MADVNQAAVVAKIRDLVATTEGIVAAFSSADSDDERLAAGITATPAALVIPGPTLAYTLTYGQQRHTYEVNVQILEAGGDIGVSAAKVAVMPDRVLAVLLKNVGLGGLCNSCVFRGSSGLQGFDYGGMHFSGYELAFEVSEQGEATPEIGR